MSEMVDFHHFIPHDEVRTTFCSQRDSFEEPFLCLLTFVDIFQLYDVSKGKKRALYIISHTKQISFDEFYAGRILKKDLEMTSNKLAA